MLRRAVNTTSKMTSKYLTLFWHFRKIQLMKQLEYRGDFIFWSLISVMWTFFNFFFFDLIASVNNGIGNWNPDQITILIGVFTILDAFTWSFFYHNMQRYTQMVFSGELNQLLSKPIDTQFILMTQTNSYNNLLRLAVGIGMIGWTLPKLGIQLGLLSLISFLAVLLVALTFIYFLWFTMSTLAFWVEKLTNINEVIPSFRKIWQVPRQVYQGVVGLLLTIVLPLGLIVSLPAEVLIQKTSFEWIGYLTLFTIGLICFSRWFFIISVKRYSGIAN